MDFIEDQAVGRFILQEYSQDSITINAKEYRRSVYLAPNTLIDDISIAASSELSIENIQFVIDMQPEILVIGTGNTLTFPTAKILTMLAQKNIGFEVMDHAAACRTYVVLASELRNVGALFLLGQSA